MQINQARLEIEIVGDHSKGEKHLSAHSSTRLEVKVVPHWLGDGVINAILKLVEVDDGTRNEILIISANQILILVVNFYNDGW